MEKDQSIPNQTRACLASTTRPLSTALLAHVHRRRYWRRQHPRMRTILPSDSPRVPAPLLEEAGMALTRWHLFVPIPPPPPPTPRTPVETAGWAATTAIATAVCSTLTPEQNPLLPLRAALDFRLRALPFRIIDAATTTTMKTGVATKSAAPTRTVRARRSA